MNAAALIQLIDAALTAAVSIGLDVHRVIAMRAMSPTGSLTDEQVKQLARERDEAVARL